MSWKVLQPFSGSFIGIPANWLIRLGLTDCLGSVKELLESRQELVKYIDQILALDPPEIEPSMRNLTLDLSTRLKEVSEDFSNEFRIDPNLRSNYLDILSEKWAKCRNIYLKTETLFTREIESKTYILQSFMSDRSFLLSALEYAPDLENLLQDEKKMHATHLGKNNPLIESALVQNISKTMGNSNANGMNPFITFMRSSMHEEHSYIKNNSKIATYEFKNHHATFSLKYAQKLRDKIVSVDDIAERLPLRLHQLVTVGETELKSSIYLFGHFFIPHAPEIKIEGELSNFLKETKHEFCILDLVERFGPSIRPLLIRLLRGNFFSHRFGIPTNTRDILEHFQNELKGIHHKNSSKTYHFWHASLEKLIFMKQTYSRSILNEKTQIMAQATTFFELLTGNKVTNREKSIRQSDNIFAIMAEATSSNVSITSSFQQILENDFSFALEFFAVDWWYKNLHRFLFAEKLNDVLNGLEKSNIQEIIGDYFKNVYIENNRIEPTLKLRNILEALSKLQEARDAIIPSDVQNKQHIEIFPDAPAVKKFRRLFRNFVKKYKFPIFAQCMLQVEKQEASDDAKTLILDSLCFGTLPYRTSNNDLDEQLTHIFQDIYAKPNKIPLNITPPTLQETDIYKVNWPGKEIEIGSLTNKPDHSSFWRNEKMPYFVGISGNCQLSVTSFPISKKVDFSPRITFGKSVLQRAQWHIDTEKYRELRDLSPSTLLSSYLVIRQFRESLNLPRFVLASPIDKDDKWLIDFENPLFVELFLTIFKGAHFLRLFEMIPEPDQFYCQTDRGRHNATFSSFMYFSNEKH